MKKLLLPLLSIALAAITAFAVIHFEAPQTSQNFAGYNPTGGGTYRLQTSIATTDSTLRLTSFKEPVSGLNYTMSYLNSSIEYATIEPQSNNREFVSFTGITQNSDGSATLTGVARGLSPSYPFTASSTFQLAHSAQSIFILSNPPQLYNNFANISNAQTITGIWTFASTSPPQYDSGFTAAGNQLVSAAQLNSIVLNGAATSTENLLGLVQLANATQVGLGTASSSSGAPIVIDNKFATTTDGALCTGSSWNCIVAATSGKISQAWLDLTQAFTFSGGIFSTASTSFTATTSIAGSNVNSKALIINSVPYQWPSSQGSSGTTLSDNGSGVLTWGGSPHYSVYSSGVTANNGYATTTTGLFVPAGTMSASSTITFFADPASGQGTNTSGNFFLADSISGKILCNLGMSDSVSSGGYNYTVAGIVYNNGSLTSQAGGANVSYNRGVADVGNTGISCTSSINTANGINIVGVMFSPAAVNFNLNGLEITVNP